MIATSSTSKRSRLRIGGRIAIGVVFSLGLGWFVIQGLDWGSVWDNFKGFPPLYAVLALAVFLSSNLIRSLRWQVLFIHERIPLMRLFLVQNEGLGLNNLSPVRVVSEATQFAILTLRDRVNGATALVTLGMERVIDVVASTTLLVVAFIFIPEVRELAIYVCGAVVFTVVVLLAVRFMAWGGHRLKFIQRIPFLASFAASLTLLESRRRRLAASVALSIVNWLLVGLTAWIVAVGFGLDVTFAEATVVIVGTVFFATAIPAMPAAIGTFEAAVVFILGRFGVPEESAFAFAVVLHALLFVPPTVIALVFLPREGLGGLRQIRDREEQLAGTAQGPPS